MKYNVKITNLSFEIDIEPIGDVVIPPVQPPVVEPPIVIPPVEPPIEPPVIIPPSENFTDEFYRLVAQGGKIILESGKTYRVNYFKETVIGNLEFATTGSGRANLLIGIENYDLTDLNVQPQSGFLFKLVDGSVFKSNNVNWCHPPQLKKSQVWAPSFFNAVQDQNAKWTVVIKNCDTTALGRNPGFGLGFLYGGIHENHVGTFNFKHCGPGLIDGKNPYPNSQLVFSAENVQTDFLNEEDFGSNKIKTRGYVKDNKFYITDPGVTTRAFYESYQFRENMYDQNETFIIHIDRYTYQWDGKIKNINDKTVQLRSYPTGSIPIIIKENRLFFQGKGQYEFHAGDSFTINGVKYTTVEKSRPEGVEFVSWVDPKDPNKKTIFEIGYTLDKPLPNGEYTGVFGNTVFELPEQDVYLIAKQNGLPVTTVNTQFGNSHTVMSTSIVGHLSYSHPNISLIWKNVQHNGYYRQGGGEQNTSRPLYMDLVNCSGTMNEFNPSYYEGGQWISVPVTSNNVQFPDRVKI